MSYKLASQALVNNGDFVSFGLVFPAEAKGGPHHHQGEGKPAGQTGSSSSVSPPEKARSSFIIPHHSECSFSS